MKLLIQSLFPHAEVLFLFRKSLEVWEKCISPPLRGFSLHEKHLRVRLIILQLLLMTPAFAIVNGFKVPDNAPIAPAIVHIISTKGQNCTGTLIRSNVVLTAAHCIFPQQKQSVIWRDKSGKRHFMKLRKSTIHPDYVPFKKGDKHWPVDLALMHLVKPTPTTIIAQSIDKTVDINDKVSIIGRGKRNFSDKTLDFDLYSAILPVVFKLGDNHMLLQDNKSGGCSGDSGAPVLLNNHIVGVVIIASAANSKGCGFNTIALILNNYIEWISKNSH
jgi:hypothetical protein